MDNFAALSGCPDTVSELPYVGMINHKFVSSGRTIASNAEELRRRLNSDTRLYDFDVLFEHIAILEGSLLLMRRGLVKAMRDNGETWERIGAALGCTKQTAWEQYH